MPTLSRRRFLKITTGGVGLAAAASALPQLPTFASTSGGEVHTVPTYCDVCFWKCGVARPFTKIMYDVINL